MESKRPTPQPADESIPVTTRALPHSFGSAARFAKLLGHHPQLMVNPIPLRFQVRAIIAIFTLLGILFASWVSRLPAIKIELGASTSQVGLLLFGLAAGTIGGLMIARRITHRLGTQRSLAWSILIASTLIILLGLATSWGNIPLVCILLIFYGACLSCTDVTMNVEGARIERDLNRTFLPLLHAFYSLGNVVGAGIGWFVGVQGIGVFAHFVIIALIAIVIIVFAVPDLGSPTAESSPSTVATAPAQTSESRTEHATTIPAGHKTQLRRDYSLWMIALLVMFTAFSEGAGNDWIALAAFEGHALEQADSSLIYATFVGAMMVGRLAGGPLVDLLGRAVALYGLTALGIAGVALFILATEDVYIYVGAGLWGLGVSLGFPLGISAAANHPTESAQRVSMVSVFGYAAMLSGPPLIGFVGHDFGLLGALWSAAGALLVALAFISSVKERRRIREEVTVPSASESD